MFSSVDTYDIIYAMAIKYTYNKDGSIKSAVTIPGSTTPSNRRILSKSETDQKISNYFKQSKSEIDQKISNYFKQVGVSDRDKAAFKRRLLEEQQ